jgi:hypothetical protein
MKGGRAHSRDECDDTIAQLHEASRRHAAATHLRRAALELQGAAAFTAVTQALLELRAPTPVIDLCARAISEELRHSDIYMALARAYSDAALQAPRASSIDIPKYPAAGADGERLLRVVGMCCVNETMACSFLELCFAGAKAPLARRGIQEILEDEIRHARVGWAYLGSSDVGPAERRLVSLWLVPIFRAQWNHWQEHIANLPAIDLVEHGCPFPEAIERASRESIHALILPGFARAGVDVSAARQWVDSEVGRAASERV